MRYLLSSLLLVLFVSCTSYPKKKGFVEVDSYSDTTLNPYFSDLQKDYVYKANIDAFGNSFGGIFVVKKIKTDHHRIVFTTEMGNKIFDFTFEGKEFKVNHNLKEMDKKILINILKNDFRVLVKEQLSVDKRFMLNHKNIFEISLDKKKYYYFQSDGDLQKIIRIANAQEKVIFLFSKINDNIAQQIQIAHQNFDLKIALKAL